MAKKKVKTAVGSILELYKKAPDKQITFGAGDSEIVVNVKQTLTLAKRREMIETIAGMVFLQSEENQKMQYCPYFRKFAIDYNIISYFTDIALTDSAESIYTFITYTDIINKILDIVGGNYIQDIVREANDMIEFKKATILKENKLDDIMSSVANFITFAKTKLEELDVDSITAFLKENMPELKGLMEMVSSQEASIQPAL